jgi:hypothetical protein
MLYDMRKLHYPRTNCELTSACTSNWRILSESIEKLHNPAV